jgi:2-polyprenyl-3-methyl-5-hydroxy-6-metoxy-1,4-benzoquinol methylase
MVHHSDCPLCSSERISLQFNCTDHFISKEVFQIFKCQECGFQFTQDYPEEGKIPRYYESDEYISHSNTSKGVSNKLYRLVRNLMVRRKRGIIIKITGLNNGSLLDIGSGTGHFAHTMKTAGWNVKGIEVNRKARDYSISNFGLEVAGPDQISTLPTGSFDCITLWHVLEHFHDPFQFAAEFNRVLKPDGICVIALPNCNSYDAKHYVKYWAAYDVPRHLWHFSPLTFKLFANKAGFQIKEQKTLPFDVFYISLLSERYKESMFPFFKGMVKAKVFAFLSLFKKDKGSSIIYLLSKSTLTN